MKIIDFRSLLLLLVSSLLFSTSCYSQFIVSYQYGIGNDTESLFNQNEHSFGLGFGQRLRPGIGILYFDLLLKTGTLNYNPAPSSDEGTKYSRTTFGAVLEYSLFSKRFQPFIGLDARIGGIQLSANKEVSDNFFGGGPTGGVRFYITRKIALDASVRRIYWLPPEEVQTIKLNPLDLLAIGIKIGVYQKK